MYVDDLGFANVGYDIYANPDLYNILKCIILPTIGHEELGGGGENNIP
jgi:hypothetical protein